jgi:hypothetical protein
MAERWKLSWLLPTTTKKQPATVVQNATTSCKKVFQIQNLKAGIGRCSVNAGLGV